MLKRTSYLNLVNYATLAGLTHLPFLVICFTQEFIRTIAFITQIGVDLSAYQDLNVHF